MTLQNEELCVDSVAKEDAKIVLPTNDTTECEQAKHAVIHATAIVQNCPYQNFIQDEWDLILRFITNKDHLKKNVMSVECRQLSNRDSKGNLFTHYVGLKIFQILCHMIYNLFLRNLV